MKYHFDVVGRLHILYETCLYVLKHVLNVQLPSAQSVPQFLTDKHRQQKLLATANVAMVLQSPDFLVLVLCDFLLFLRMKSLLWWHHCQNVHENQEK